MSGLHEFDNRIAAALDRIRAGLAGPAATPVAAAAGGTDADLFARLRAELDEERMVNAQMEERVRLLKDRQESRIAHLEAALAEERARMTALDHDLQSLRASNSDLREVIGALRQALASELAQPELVNRAIMAELDALRATRDADRAELNAVIAELEPLIGEAR